MTTVGYGDIAATNFTEAYYYELSYYYYYYV